MSLSRIQSNRSSRASSNAAQLSLLPQGLHWEPHASSLNVAVDASSCSLSHSVWGSPSRESSNPRWYRSSTRNRSTSPQLWTPKTPGVYRVPVSPTAQYSLNTRSATSLPGSVPSVLLPVKSWSSHVAMVGVSRASTSRQVRDRPQR